MNLLKSTTPLLSLLLISSLSYPINAENVEVHSECEQKAEVHPECEQEAKVHPECEQKSESSEMNDRIAIVENSMYGATLAWKKPNIVITKKEDQLGLIESGAKVKILCELQIRGMIKFVTQVEILEGRLKGKVGWVASSNIRIR